MHFRPLLNWIAPALKPLEKHLLLTLASRLQPQASAILRRQIGKINFVQRHNGREVCMYRIKFGNAFWSEADSFPKRTELKLATIKFKTPHSLEVFSADFLLVRGRLFSIVFDRDPKAINEADRIEVVDVQIRCDPVTPSAPVSISPPEDPTQLSGWPREWFERYPVRDLKKPLPKEERDELVSRIDAILPHDYLELISQSEGLSISNISILGISQVYEVNLPEQTYYLLAQVRDLGMIGVMEDPSIDGIYFVDFDGDKRVSLGKSFRSAIEQMIPTQG